MTDLEVLRVVIVDDEDLARLGLRRDLACMPGCDVIAECRDGFEAVRTVSELRPDLVLLDIQMPRLDGFDVLEMLDPGIAVIFVTAHDEHAIRAFQVHAVDYLLKPVDPERLRQALDRARDRLRHRRGIPVKALTAAARPPGLPIGRILIRDGARVHVIPVEKIDYIQAQDDYVAIHSAGRCHLKQQTIGALEAALDPRRFIRIHRSYILNIDRLDRIELYAKDSRIVILQDGARLPLSRSGHTRLRALL
jgi:two-component system, LytTR family, response regulator